MTTYMEYARQQFELAHMVDVEGNVLWLEEHLEEYAYEEYENAHPAIQEVLNTIIKNLIERETE